MCVFCIAVGYLTVEMPEQDPSLRGSFVNSAHVSLFLHPTLSQKSLI